ncbi:hypothetical protein ABM34_12805 [Companilactobacillus ginsenosidimutans]|uniref:Uncharacterized protein n=1 Tax=Companilactobacillus ginsenosidimutans TaxID=1007676 RepID=A0A0H4QMI1_9LACO|nr:hypothetical protein ABM34_00170 [Companilactobacillus ginsenosidimutans]AKP68331.1 hypothetical protein ABM34_12805 [Companilactobacillus ginsenosidimutans]
MVDFPLCGGVNGCITFSISTIGIPVSVFKMLSVSSKNICPSTTVIFLGNSFFIFLHVIHLKR